MNFKWLISWILFAGLLLLGMTACAKIARSQGQDRALAQPRQLEINTLLHDNISRIYGVYAPESRSEVNAPLVFLLHGGGGGAQQIFNTEFGQSWAELADEHGFILAVPQGRQDIGSPGDHHWNDCRNNILNPDVNTQLDDVGFITSLIDVLDAFYGVDMPRVYVTGASNGGMMSFRLAFEATSHFAAIGAVIASHPTPSECDEPTAPLSVLIMNGTEDPLIPYDGGCVANNACRRGSVASTDETLHYWIEHNDASQSPVINIFPDTDTRDGSTVTSYTYADGLRDTEVVLYKVDGGGHTVPGEEPIGAAARLVVGPKNRDINGADEIWAFFERHQR